MPLPTAQEQAATALHDALLWLRNGAIAAGSDPLTADYRESCMERAYVIVSQDLLPALVTLGIVPVPPHDQKLSNLADVSAMMQKKVITRPPS
jgi:hypothetical protein